jgi:hypothetical protein
MARLYDPLCLASSIQETIALFSLLFVRLCPLCDSFPRPDHLLLTFVDLNGNTYRVGSKGELFKLEALEQAVQEFRRFYASPDLHKWINDVLPTLSSSWNLQLTPLEQFVDLTETYCAGERLMYGPQFKPLVHITDGVWELETADLRIFGWFHKNDCFIGAVADDATRIKQLGLYHGYANVTTKRFQEALDLDDPKYIPGDDPHAVVSNFDYA